MDGHFVEIPAKVSALLNLNKLVKKKEKKYEDTDFETVCSRLKIIKMKDEFEFWNRNEIVIKDADTNFVGILQDDS